MEEQEQYILEDQALNVLSLFPKRQAPPLIPTLQVYSKLFESLTCTICRQIFTNPVYLKCSHRFCKECIEKYIRSNSRKSCPNCRGGLTTKRDLRSDFNIESLITFAFGDAKKMSKQLEQIEKLQYSQIQRQKSLQIKRAQSMTDLKNKPKENGEQAIVSATSLKRNKTMDGQQPRRRRSQKKIKADPQKQKEKEGTPSRKVRQTDKSIKKQEGQVQIEVRKKRKNHVMVIQIESSDPVEVQQIPPEQFFHAEQNPLEDNNKFSSLMCSISMIPQVSQIQSAKKISSIHQLQKIEAIRPESVSQFRIPEKMDIEQVASQPTTIAQQVMVGFQALKQQFGNNFLNKIIQLTDYNIYMRLRLKKHPAQPFTPSTTFLEIKVFAKITASCISSIIADDLNINKQSIKLFVCQEHTNNYIEVSLVTKLQEINNRFWRSFGGYEIIELSQKILVENDNDVLSRYCSSWENRILYYSVDYSKIIF